MFYAKKIDNVPLMNTALKDDMQDPAPDVGVQHVAPSNGQEVQGHVNPHAMQPSSTAYPVQNPQNPQYTYCYYIPADPNNMGMAQPQPMMYSSQQPQQQSYGMNQNFFPLQQVMQLQQPQTTMIGGQQVQVLQVQPMDYNMHANNMQNMNNQMPNQMNNQTQVQMDQNMMNVNMQNQVHNQQNMGENQVHNQEQNNIADNHEAPENEKNQDGLAMLQNMSGLRSGGIFLISPGPLSVWFEVK